MSDMFRLFKGAASAAAVVFLGIALQPGILQAQQSGPIHGGGGVTLPLPPPTPIIPVVDQYRTRAVTACGQPPCPEEKSVSQKITVVDNYRWLESDHDPLVRQWIGVQMAYTQLYLSQVKNRPRIAQALTSLMKVDSETMPLVENGVYFFKKKMADQNQGSIYMRRGLQGADTLLVDASKLSADQNSSATIWDAAKDAKFLVYGVREGGADEQTIHVRDAKTEQDLPDVLPRARYFGVSLAPKSKGLYYATYTKAGAHVYCHSFGTPVSADKMIFGDTYKGRKLGPLDLTSVRVSENERYLVLQISHGVPAKQEDILVKDLRHPASDWQQVIYGIQSRFSAHVVGDAVYAKTDYKSPNGRIVKVDIAHPEETAWTTVVPEGTHVIDAFTVTGKRLFVTKLADVKTQTSIYDLDGKQVGKLSYPGIGTGSPVQGRADEKIGFYSFQSLNQPPTIYSYDTSNAKSNIFFAEKVPFVGDRYEVRQVFFRSKDGTRVPMFIVGRKGLPHDGSVPTLMTAYGGFNIGMTPKWDPEYAWWLAQGGFFALPNLRGGSEYGEAWHEAGMFQHKQNVFDDFYGAAEYLVANHYTTSKLLAIRGRSNGGLLMGAAMTQRPDLFGAIWCGFPLLDMLRYQNFLVGRFWTTEYGSSEDPSQLSYLMKYSPYQNVQAGAKYPAIMFFSGDSDTRVAPLHARKMTAAMQAASGSDRPILLHYELKAGHSSGVSIQQLVDDYADELAFLWNETAGTR
ncbi:MAG: prolyl oligopeptidase family serine peptidase [Acidobacteriaceae bacterium]